MPEQVASERSVCRHAGVLLLRDDDAVLLQQRDLDPELRHPGIWVGPGGRCECRESEETCARRELCEETGYRCGALIYAGEFVDDFAPDWPLVVNAVFCARYDGQQTIRCHEGRAMVFVERDRASQIPILPALLDFWDRAIVLLDPGPE